MEHNPGNNLSKSLEDLQNKEIIKTKLLLSSLYLTAFEILKSSIVDQVQKFYVDPNEKPNFLYKTEVLKLDKDPFKASTLWLKSMDVINKNDLDALTRIRKYRNEIAHEVSHIVFYHDRNINLEYLNTIKKLIAKIDSWWIHNVEIPIHDAVTNNNFSNKEDLRVFSGPMIILDIIIDAVVKNL